jgi:hypothetical protein
VNVHLEARGIQIATAPHAQDMTCRRTNYKNYVADQLTRNLFLGYLKLIVNVSRDDVTTPIQTSRLIPAIGAACTAA